MLFHFLEIDGMGRRVWKDAFITRSIYAILPWLAHEVVKRIKVQLLLHHYRSHVKRISGTCLPLPWKFLQKELRWTLNIFFVAAWSIWYNRNQIVYESTNQLPHQTWNFAMRYLQYYKEATLAPRHNESRESRSWSAPPSGFFKINVDGASSEWGQNSSVGVIIRDSYGATIAACTKYLPGIFSVIEVETLAVEAGIFLAREMEQPHVIIESDAMSVVQSINTGELEGCLGHLYQGIFSLLSSFTSWKIMHVKREYNRVAHKLAQSAKRWEESQV